MTENAEDIIENKEVIDNENQEIPQFTVRNADENQPIVEIEEEIEEEVVETPEVIEAPVVETEKEVLNQIDDNSVLEFLKGKGFDSITSLDDLKPKEVKKLRPEVEKFNEFVEKTGNTDFNAFLETQKDYSTVSAEEKLIALLKIDNPDLTEKEIDFLYNKKYAVDELEQDDTDIVMEKGINAKADLRRANEVLEKRKQEFMVPKGFEETIPEDYKQAKSFYDQAILQQKENAKLIEQSIADYTAKTNSVFTNDFEGFKIKVGNEKTGFEELVVKPENIQETKNAQSNLDNFNKKFFDDKGNLTDPTGFHKALYFGMNTEKIAEHFYNLGKAKLAEDEDKRSKNIQNNNLRPLPTGKGSNITVKEVK